MVRLYLVRHGRAAAGFDVADPGLDDLGREQAATVAKKLEPLGPLSVLTSPLRRTRETAWPLAYAWKREPVVEEAVAEIPTPAGLDVETRVPWLRRFMMGTWREADTLLTAWRERVLSTLKAQREDTVLFSHFVAINVGVGHTLEDDRVVVFSPDNCSVTILETDGRELRLIERGAEAATKVN
jgi:broad specificity phosphatase PhoE